MFCYTEGDVVSLLKDRPSLGLSRGDRGVVWCMYTTDPPAYEVTFWKRDGSGIDLTMDEDQVAATGLKSPVFEKPVFEPEAVVA
jgi:hypothetical protein